MRALRVVLAVVALVAAIAGCGSSKSKSVGEGSTNVTRTQTTTVDHQVRNATPQSDWVAYTGPVPILVYHDLGDAPADAKFPGLYVSDADFSAEMAWLHAQGYQAVTLDEMMDAWYHGGKLPAKPIVITFDNGYLPQVTFAPAVMAKYGWPGVLNEITANHLNNAQIWHVLHMGWEVDSHSVTHPDLTAITATELHYQVFASREFLQKTFDIPSNSFCYPSSKYNAAVIAMVKAAGYTNAVTEGHAYATKADPYLLPRFEIEGGVDELAADLATAH